MNLEFLFHSEMFFLKVHSLPEHTTECRNLLLMSLIDTFVLKYFLHLRRRTNLYICILKVRQPTKKKKKTTGNNVFIVLLFIACAVKYYSIFAKNKFVAYCEFYGRLWLTNTRLILNHRIQITVHIISHLTDVINRLILWIFYDILYLCSRKKWL